MKLVLNSGMSRLSLAFLFALSASAWAGTPPPVERFEKGDEKSGPQTVPTYPQDPSEDKNPFDRSGDSKGQPPGWSDRGQGDRGQGDRSQGDRGQGDRGQFPGNQPGQNYPGPGYQDQQLCSGVFDGYYIGDSTPLRFELYSFGNSTLQVRGSWRGGIWNGQGSCVQQGPYQAQVELYFPSSPVHRGVIYTQGQWVVLEGRTDYGGSFRVYRSQFPYGANGNAPYGNGSTQF